MHNALKKAKAKEDSTPVWNKMFFYKKQLYSDEIIVIYIYKIAIIRNKRRKQ